MRTYCFTLTGASPGYNSAVVVIASSIQRAKAMAQAAINDYNNSDDFRANVTLDEEYTTGPATGVVYFFSGEA